MPPRLPASCSAQQLVNCLMSPLLSAAQRTATAAGRPSWPSTANPHVFLPPSSSSPSLAAPFSTTTPRELSRKQRAFWRFIRGGVGKKLRTLANSQQDKTQYLGAIPPPGETKPGHWLQVFSTNPYFRSMPVLSFEARERIWENVMKAGLPLKAVSARYSVDVRRVAAVVRLMEMEKRMEENGEPMALPYAKAVTKMLPRHNCTADERPFEPINDIHVHSYTQQQIFWPTSESRHFTRADAAKAFGDHILPPEEKLWVPELIQFEKDVSGGVSVRDARASFLTAAAKSEQALADKYAAEAKAEEAANVRVNTSRFEMRFQDVNVDSSGRDGRSRKGVGWRYGVPFGDRRRGAVKIPTKVE